MQALNTYFKIHMFIRSLGLVMLWINRLIKPLLLISSSLNCCLNPKYFDNDLEIMNDFAKYLKESCW